MNGQSLENVNSSPYLGVIINNKLQWNSHIDKISSEANRMLGFLWRTMYRGPKEIKDKVYKATVRQKLEYCSSIWDPYTSKSINKLEMVQRRATRFVMSKPHRKTGAQPSVSDMIHNLGWPSLMDRRLDSRLTLFYKMKNNLTEVPVKYHPEPARNQRPSRKNSQQLLQQHVSIDNYKYAFIPRTTVDWNSLPSEVVNAESLDVFKERLAAYRR